MSRVFLSLGSNIAPQTHVPRCLEILKSKFNVKKVSSIYETPPLGPAGNTLFWNLVVEIDSDLDKKTLVGELRQIELGLGRKRSGKNKFEPRTMDIDILPQPDYQKQAFVMAPLAEIAPEATDLETGKTFAELAAKIKKDALGFRKVSSA